MSNRPAAWSILAFSALLVLPGVLVHAPSSRATMGGGPTFGGPAPGRGDRSPIGPNAIVPTTSRGTEGAVRTLRVRTEGTFGGPRWYDASPGLPASSLWNGFEFTGSSPPALYGAAMATDPNTTRGAMSVMFGGATSTGTPQNRTWIYWSNESVGPAYWQESYDALDVPPAVAFASMGFDQFAQEFVLFGGFNVNGVETNQTWLFSPVSFTWTNDTSGACRLECPAARQGAAMGFERPGPRASLTVLFGGCYDDCRQFLNDTWYFVSIPPYGSHWSEVAANLHPSARFGAAFSTASFGTSGQGLVLFGGSTGADPTSAQNDTWAFTGGNWTNLSGEPTMAVAPSGLTGAAMTYDWQTGSATLAGGMTTGSDLSNLTWELACSTTSCRWSESLPAGGGPAVAFAGVSTDTWSSEPVLFGGIDRSGGAPGNATWVFQNDTNLTLNVSDGAPETGEMVYLNASVQGGSRVGPPVDRAFSVWWYAQPGGASTFLLGGWPTYSRIQFAYPGLWYVNATAFDYFDVAQSLRFVLDVVAPHASAGASARATDVGVPVNFTSEFEGVHAADGFTCRWNFGDGGTATGQNATHAYNATGTFTAEVVIRDAVGGTAAAEVSVDVHSLPSTVIGANATVMDPGGTANFTSEVFSGTPPYSYFWNFEDGTPTSRAAFPAHTFEVPGVHVVQFRVTDAVGSWANASLPVLVNPNLTARTGVSATVAPAGTTIQFTVAGAGGTGAYHYAWLFGDGSGAAGSPVDHAYGSTGRYLATVWINDTDHSSLRVLFTEDIGPRPSVLAFPGWPWILLAGLGLVAVAFAVARLRALRRVRSAKPGPASTARREAWDGAPESGSYRIRPPVRSGARPLGGPPLPFGRPRLVDGEGPAAFGPAGIAA